MELHAGAHLLYGEGSPIRGLSAAAAADLVLLPIMTLLLSLAAVILYTPFLSLMAVLHVRSMWSILSAQVLPTPTEDLLSLPQVQIQFMCHHRQVVIVRSYCT